MRSRYESKLEKSAMTISIPVFSCRDNGLLNSSNPSISPSLANPNAHVFSRRLAKRFHMDQELILPMLSGLDFVHYRELSEKILEAESLDEIKVWLERAPHN